MTDQEQAINVALEKSHGDRGYAASLLGIETREVANAILSSKRLRERWTGQTPTGGAMGGVVPNQVDAPTDVQALSRRPLDLGGDEPSQDERRALALYLQEGAAFRSNLRELGFAETEVERADALAELSSRHLKRSLHLSMGNVTAFSVSATAEADTIKSRQKWVAEQLADVDKHPIGSLSRGALVHEENLLRNHFLLLMNSIRLFGDLSIKSAFIISAVEKKNGHGKEKSAKPGFTTVARADNPE